MAEYPPFVILRRGRSSALLLAFGLIESEGFLEAPAFAVLSVRDVWRTGSVFDAYEFKARKAFAKLKLAEKVNAPQKLVRFEPLRFEVPNL